MNANSSKQPDIAGFRATMQIAAPGKRHQNSVLLKETLEIVREARSRGVPWTEIGEGLEAFGVCITVARLKKAFSAECKQRIPHGDADVVSSASHTSESNPADPEISA